MDRYAYERIVRRLELQASINPVLYRSQVLVISCLAYVALFAALCIVSSIIYLAFSWAREGTKLTPYVYATLFTLSAIPLFFAVLRMFFMRLPPPEGSFITREQAPKLFGVLDKMRKKLKGPPIHYVIVDDCYNASIYQRPRWGLFGGHTNYLTLGLPYLLSMPPQEMLATVAHEYGHLCGNHGKFSAWVYRQRRTFLALYRQVNEGREDSWLHGMLAYVLDRFIPYYDAYTFVLSRQDEYEADLTATQLIGAETNAKALIRGELLGNWFHEDFWSTIYRQAEARAHPTLLPYSSMKIAFEANYSEWATNQKLQEAWSLASGLNDTHPALRNRVEATGHPPCLPPAVDMNAAEALLGVGTTKHLISLFDQEWWAREKEEWQSRYRHVVRSRQRLHELTQPPLNALALQDLQELALLINEFESPQAAKPVLEHLMKRPGGPFPKASYLYGQILLDESNDRGLDYLATAAKHDRRLVEQAANLGYHYQYAKHGENAAQAWWSGITDHDVQAA